MAEPVSALRLLLVDDSTDVCQTLRAMLSSRRTPRLRDYTITQVGSVQAGLEAMREDGHECYLVDYRVRNESGLDLVRSARRDNLLVPIVMLTNSDMIDAEAADAGATDFLVKGSFDVPMFERTIRYAIGNAESLRRLAELNSRLEAQVSERTRQYLEANNRLKEQIAAREQAESALLQTERLQALGRMTGSVAHDFNNILTALFSSLELLERRLSSDWGDTPDPRLERPLVTAIAASRVGERMVEGLLAFARRRPVAPTRLDANEVIRDSERLLRLTLGGGADLRLDLAAAPAPVCVDRDQLERALLNLASNARDAMAGTPMACFTVRTVHDGPDEGSALPQDGLEPGPEARHGRLRIIASDTGSGMTEEALAHAFEPFFTTKHDGQGTGLGLAQVYGFTQQSGGEARIESSPGRGVCVTLTLPLTD